MKDWTITPAELDKLVDRVCEIMAEMDAGNHDKALLLELAKLIDKIR